MQCLNLKFKFIKVFVIHVLVIDLGDVKKCIDHTKDLHDVQMFLNYLITPI